MTLADLTPLVLVSALLSIIFEWAPGLSDWYEMLSTKRKQFIMAVLILVVSLGMMWYQCQYNAVCPENGWQATIESLVITALISAAANQSTWLLTKRS